MLDALKGCHKKYRFEVHAAERFNNLHGSRIFRVADCHGNVPVAAGEYRKLTFTCRLFGENTERFRVYRDVVEVHVLVAVLWSKRTDEHLLLLMAKLGYF